MARRVCVDEIYEATFDDEAFAQVASSLASSFGARSALIHWIHHDGATDVLSHSGYFTDEQLALYAREFVAIDPWVHATSGPDQVNRVHNLEEIVPVPEFTASDFYNQYVRAIGDDTCRGIGIRLQNDWGTGFIALQRGLKQPWFEPDDVRLLARNFQHVRRMLSIRGKVAAMRHRADTLSGVLDAMGHATFVVERDMRVKHLNRAGEQMLRTAGVLRIQAGRLSAALPQPDELLRVAVARICASQRSEPSAVALRSPDGSRLNLTIVAAPPVAGRRLALILASDRRPDDSRASRLRSLYGLSNAEASLAVMLADGASPAEIAERRYVSVGTVRVQIKQIAFKLGCRGQREIVRLVTELPVIHSA